MNQVLAHHWFPGNTSVINCSLIQTFFFWGSSESGLPAQLLPDGLGHGPRLSLLCFYYYHTSAAPEVLSWQLAAALEQGLGDSRTQTNSSNTLLLMSQSAEDWLSLLSQQLLTTPLSNVPMQKGHFLEITQYPHMALLPTGWHNWAGRRPECRDRMSDFWGLIRRTQSYQI